MPPRDRTLLTAGWIVSAGLAIAVRAWNAIFGPLFYGYDAWGHIAYVFFLDMYRAVPFADQGWSFFHPPLHYLFGWVLMQSGDPDVLVVGLSLLGGAASLGVAAIAAAVVRQTLPDRPGAGLLAFTAIAFLPVHVYTSPMPGNEMTAALLAAAAFAAHLRNESRQRPSITGDLVTGALAGLAMLSKFTDLIALLAIGALTATLWLRRGVTRESTVTLAKRAVAIGVPVIVLAGPYYARNIAEFGTPFMTSARVADVERIQSSQPPGERHLADYFRVPTAVVEDSVPSAPHMLRAVWPTVYLNVWFDTFHESQLPFPRNLAPHPFIHKLTLLFGVLGLVPTGIVLLGGVASLRRALHDDTSVADTGMCILASGTLAAFVLFSIQIPTWAALKASYLLNLSLPFAYFLARGSAWLGERNARLGSIAGVAVGMVALASAYVFATGRPPGLMRRDFDSMQMHSIRAHFGEYQATRRNFRADAPKRGYIEARAAAELFDGNAHLARRFYERAGQMEADDSAERPYWLNRLAVAHALDDHPERARMLLDEGLESRSDTAGGTLEELLVNRAVLHARDGHWTGAERDLRAALEIAPQLPPAWANLARVLEALGREDEATHADARFEEVTRMAPRGFPYGVGNGFLYQSGAGQRFLLMLDADGDLTVYRPPRARNRPRARS